MKLWMFAALVFFFSSTAFAAQPQTEASQPFQFASAASLKSNSLPAVDNATTDISEYCWITYSTCMLHCGFADPALFPVDACSEACFNEYMSCAGL